MLCLPLGGVSLYEVLVTYLAMAASIILFGMICVAASSYFTRTIAALVVSYLIILPLALVFILFYSACEGLPRLVIAGGFFPPACIAACVVLFGGHQPPAAPSARRRRRGQGRGRFRPGAAQGGGHGHPQRPVPRPALRPAEARRPHGRPRQSRLRQGNAERTVRAGDPHAPAGHPVEHVPGAAADGRLPLHAAGPGRLVYLLRGAVQHAGRARSSRPAA